jgi:hypothetical protein
MTHLRLSSYNEFSHIRKQARLSYILSLIGEDYKKFPVEVIQVACDGVYNASPETIDGVKNLAILLSTKYVNLTKLGRGSYIVSQIRKIKEDLPE